jgi:hypothetical protein
MAIAYKSGSDLINLAPLQLQLVQLASASLGVCCTNFELLGIVDHGVWVPNLY